MVFGNNLTNQLSACFLFGKGEFLSFSGKNQCLLPFRCMIQPLSIYLFFCGRKGIPILDSIQGIYKRKLCRLRCRVVIQCKRNNGDSCFLMLCLLCVSDELNRKPESTDYIALTATVLPVNGSTRQNPHSAIWNEHTFQRTCSRSFHRKSRFVSKRPIIFHSKLNQHNTTPFLLIVYPANQRNSIEFIKIHDFLFLI